MTKNGQDVSEMSLNENIKLARKCSVHIFICSRAVHLSGQTKIFHIFSKTIPSCPSQRGEKIAERERSGGKVHSMSGNWSRVFEAGNGKERFPRKNGNCRIDT